MTHAWRSGMVVLVLAASASARQRESHIAIEPSANGLTPTQLIDQKLGDADTNQIIRKLLNDPFGVDPKLREQLLHSKLAESILDRLAKGDPQLMNLVEQIAAGHPHLKGLDRAE